MALVASSPPEQGQLVMVRHRPFIVHSVARSVLPDRLLKPHSAGAQHLVSLSSVDEDSLGEELQVVWEIEPGAHVLERVALPEPAGMDDPVRLDAFLDAVRWGAACKRSWQPTASPRAIG